MTRKSKSLVIGLVLVFVLAGLALRFYLYRNYTATQPPRIQWPEAEALIRQCEVSYVDPHCCGFTSNGSSGGAGYDIQLKDGSLRTLVDNLPSSAELDRVIQGVSSTCGSVVVRPVHPMYVADFADDRILMGGSHNVFVGKIISQIGTEDNGAGTETQFTVEVLSNIKGNLQGTVTVDQEGGYKDGVLYVVEGGDNNGDTMGPHRGGDEGYLLHPGYTYLLATRYSETYNWHTLNSFPTARKLLSSDSSLTDSQLQTLADSDIRVRQLESAYPNEILLDADIKHNNTRNSYISTHTPPPAPPPPPPAPSSTEPIAPPPPPAAVSTSSATSTGN